MFYGVFSGPRGPNETPPTVSPSLPPPLYAKGAGDMTGNLLQFSENGKTKKYVTMVNYIYTAEVMQMQDTLGTMHRNDFLELN